MTRPDPAGSVPAYYDRNTAWFLRAAGRAESGSLHRALWGPGVQSRRQALAYVDDLVVEVLERRVREGHSGAHVVDLGCGVGATVTRLASRPDVRVTGLTSSARQAELARDRVRRHGVAARCSIRHQDLRAPGQLPPADLAVAIESLSHVGDRQGVFAALRRYVRDAGWLLVCDDFEGAASARYPARRARWLRRFRDGWHLGGLVTVQAFVAVAADHGFSLVEDRDLTPYMRYDNEVLLHLCHALHLVPARSGMIAGLRGGAAGQRCLKRGWAEYRLLLLRRR